MDYLIHFRIQRACRLLDNSNLKVTEVLQHVGYEVPFYCSRIYNKIMGFITGINNKYANSPLSFRLVRPSDS